MYFIRIGLRVKGHGSVRAVNASAAILSLVPSAPFEHGQAISQIAKLRGIDHVFRQCLQFVLDLLLCALHPVFGRWMGSEDLRDGTGLLFFMARPAAWRTPYPIQPPKKIS